MTRRDQKRATALGSRMGILLLGLTAVLLGAVFPAQAENCSDYLEPGASRAVIDGFDGIDVPAQLQIDMDCEIRNFPADNPLRTNFSFYTQPGHEDDRWLVIFNNVVHLGEMSCNEVHGHKIWFTNGSSTEIKSDCQGLLIPVEKIDKQNPPGQTTATIGVPFTYSLTIPVLFDPATGAIIHFSGSPNDLWGVTITDDLNETGAALIYLSHVAYWEDSHTPVPHTFSNSGGALTFDFETIPGSGEIFIIPAERQIVIEITVVLDDTPANAVGNQFINTAKWDFGRYIDGVMYKPLPGEWGVSPPLTIAAPELVVTKTGPATLGLTLNLGQWGEFTIDVQNTGLSDAWNVTILDRLPDSATGGMCNLTPEVLSAQVFAADGVTPVPGKGPLIAGTDFSLSYSGAPSCELAFTMLTAAAAIGPTERLIITYRTQLDADSQDGATLTNVVGATEWFNGESSDSDRQRYTRPLTDGSVGVLDHEDAHTVTAELYGYFFEKSVENLTSGVSPTTTAAPGDTLRYTLRLQTTDVPLEDLAFVDDLGRLNAPPVFEPGTLSLVTVPEDAVTSATDPTGGSNGTGLVDVGNLSVPSGSEIVVQFDITLDSSLTDGTVVTNQSDLISTVSGVDLADSDDPNINGQADPDVEGDENPTRVVIAEVPVGPLLKESTQATASVGESFRYRITVPETPYPYPVYDVQITDDLTASAADLRFLEVSKVSGSEPWVPVNTGTDTNVVIEDTTIGIDIPAGEQVVVEVTVVLEDTTANVADLTFSNTAAFLYNLRDGDVASQRAGDPGTSGPMTVVEPDLTLDKSGPATMTIGTPETFTLDIRNVGGGPAWNVTLTDLLPDTASGGTCGTAPAAVTAQVFEADGTTPVSGPLVEGTDFSVSFSAAPACEFVLAMLSANSALGVGQRLLVTYEARLDPDTQDGAALTNVAGATEWFSTDGLDPQTAGDRRTYTRALTDGTVEVPDHEDAHTVNVALPSYLFEKTVVNLTSGADPATTAAPGDRLLYRLRVENRGDIPLEDFAVFDELDRLNDPPAFQPGTLDVVTLPGGADDSNTSRTGGAEGTGVLDVRSLSLPGAGDSLLIEFEITLAPVIANKTLVTNQAQLLVDDVAVADSDDPNVDGPADPAVPDDEDPTQVLIESGPSFLVEKVSSDVTGDPAVLLAGETLRYTITVKNVGTDDAVDVVLRDDVPVNTAYIAGSTTLNGAPVTDGPSGIAPLADGILIHAPEDPTPGAMRADASATESNVATIVFDVVIDEGVIDGTVISNQAFVSAIDGGVSDHPSDDPRTPIADDPTRDVVGSVPLVFAAKDVALLEDQGTPDMVDPGDLLHYSITVHNSGAVAATAVTLADDVPANTTYEEDSLTLNGLPVGRPDAGVSPLVAGIPISSADLTPPLPGAGQGTISAGGTALVEFDLRVDDGVPAGTIISNQATLSSEQVPSLLSDGDGDPTTGPEPTIVVVGDSQQLSITKQVAVVGGGPALNGSQLEYVVRVVNIAAVAAYWVVITDDLDAPESGQLSYVDGSATINGSTDGVIVAGPVLTADYFTLSGPLQPGESVVLRFRAVIDAGVPIGTTITNTGEVTWNTPQKTASASVSVVVGGIPGIAALNGAVWHDADFDNAMGLGERVLEGWSVELYRNGQPWHSVMTDADGLYRIAGLEPNDVDGVRYELRFRAPGAGANTAALGMAHSDFTNDLQKITDIVVPSGVDLQDLNLPIDPNGVVYNALERTPIAGATLTLLDGPGGAPLPLSCFDDPAQQGQVTRSDGYYKFDLNFSEPVCPSGGNYVIAVAAGSEYADGYSQIIPPTSGPLTPPLSVPACPGSADDAVQFPPRYCEAQPSEFAPLPSVPARSAGTNYHVHLMLDGSHVPGSSQIFNNHIPLDPVLEGAVGISKTTPKLRVSRGQLVPYEITIGNELGVALPDLSIVDRYPAGFRYVKGSARLDGVPVEPTINGLELTWTDLGVGSASRRSLLLLLAVGAGVSDGEYVNRAQAVSSLTGLALSGEATASVRVVPDPSFACTDVMGKVFDDVNRNGIQDAGERGLPGVRLVSLRGLTATTDAHGRYHITCALAPDDRRGSNFVLKLDDRTLPSGYRMSTRPVQVQRATRGKALRLNYAASIHRVVALDMADAVFEPGSTEMRPQWKPRIELLLDELAKAPATLRLSYVADIEEPRLVDRRLDAVKKQIARAWKERDGGYSLTIEREVFWHRGAPPEKSTPRMRGSR